MIFTYNDNARYRETTVTLTCLLRAGDLVCSYETTRVGTLATSCTELFISGNIVN